MSLTLPILVSLRRELLFIIYLNFLNVSFLSHMDFTSYKRLFFAYFPKSNTFFRDILLLKFKCSLLYYLHSSLISHIFEVLLWYSGPHTLKPQIKERPKALLKHMQRKVAMNLHLHFPQDSIRIWAFLWGTLSSISQLSRPLNSENFL